MCPEMVVMMNDEQLTITLCTFFVCLFFNYTYLFTKDGNNGSYLCFVRCTIYLRTGECLVPKKAHSFDGLPDKGHAIKGLIVLRMFDQIIKHIIKQGLVQRYTKIRCQGVFPTQRLSEVNLRTSLLTKYIDLYTFLYIHVWIIKNTHKPHKDIDSSGCLLSVVWLAHK